VNSGARWVARPPAGTEEALVRIKPTARHTAANNATTGNVVSREIPIVIELGRVGNSDNRVVGITVDVKKIVLFPDEIMFLNSTAEATRNAEITEKDLSALGTAARDPVRTAWETLKLKEKEWNAIKNTPGSSDAKDAAHAAWETADQNLKTAEETFADVGGSIIPSYTLGTFDIRTGSDVKTEDIKSENFAVKITGADGTIKGGKVTVSGTTATVTIENSNNIGMKYTAGDIKIGIELAPKPESGTDTLSAYRDLFFSEVITRKLAASPLPKKTEVTPANNTAEMRISTAIPGTRPSTTKLTFQQAATPYWGFEDLEFAVSTGTPNDNTTTIYQFNTGVEDNITAAVGNKVWVRVKAGQPYSFIKNAARTPWIELFEFTEANKAAQITPQSSASVGNRTISGTMGADLVAGQTVTITLVGSEGFKDITLDDVINSAADAANRGTEQWFTNLPKGLEAKVTEITPNTLTVTISGTPKDVRSAPIDITIPKEFLEESPVDVIVNRNESAKFEIVKASATVTNGIIGTAAGSPVGVAIDQDITITLNGATFTTEFQSTENGTEIAWIKNFPDSFTGEKFTATIKTITSPNIVVINIKGTPTAASSAYLDIKIPANVLNEHAGEIAILTSAARFNILGQTARIQPGVTINGTVGTDISSSTIIIRLENDKFRNPGGAVNDPINILTTTPEWNINIPNGLSATATIQSDPTIMHIVISGKPQNTSTANINITIPSGFLENRKEINADLVVTTAQHVTANWNISPAPPQPTTAP